MRNVGVVTVGRSDYGIYSPILKRIRDDHELTLNLMVSGMHLPPEFGLTVEAIEAARFVVDEQVETLLSSNTPKV